MNARSGILSNCKRRGPIIFLLFISVFYLSGCNDLRFNNVQNLKEFIYVTHIPYTNGNSPTEYLISQYSISANGQLTPLNPQTVSAGFEGNAIFIDPSHKYAYVFQGYCIFGLSISSIAQYKVNTDGTLTFKSSNVATGCSITFDPSGKYVYIGIENIDGTNQITQYTVQPDGTLQCVGITSMTGYTYLVFNNNGSYAYAANRSTGTISQYSVDAGGVLHALTPATIQSGVSALAQPSAVIIHPSNQFVYSANWVDGTISQFSVNTDGTLRALNPANVATVSCPDSMAVDPTGKYLYVASCAGGPIGQFSIGLGGTLTPLSPATVSAGNGSYTLAIDPSGRYLYVANAADNTISQYSVGANGTLSPLSPASIADSSGPEGIISIAFAQ